MSSDAKPASVCNENSALLGCAKQGNTPKSHKGLSRYFKLSYHFGGDL